MRVPSGSYLDASFVCAELSRSLSAHMDRQRLQHGVAILHHTSVFTSIVYETQMCLPTWRRGRSAHIHEHAHARWRFEPMQARQTTAGKMFMHHRGRA